jgi:hypothetical protein
MTKLKMALVALAVVLAALAGGWLWGAWGRWASETQLREAELRVQLAEARASLLAARVDLFEINFGQASADIERAKNALGTAAAILERSGQGDALAAVREATSRAGEAQQFAGSVDQTAGARVADSLAALAMEAAAVDQK